MTVAIIILVLLVVGYFVYKILDKNSPVTPPGPPGPGGILPDNVHLTVVNQATGISSSEVDQYVSAQQLQIDNDFQPYWGGTAVIDTVPGGWPIYLIDDADIPNALGYHDVDSNNVPFAKVFVKTSEDNGVTWQSVASHEVLETLTDSNAETSVTGPDGCQWFREASDSVEDITYVRNNVELSDFVTPAYFDVNAKGPYDFIGDLKAPFTLTPGGYAPEQCGGARNLREGPRKTISVDREYHRLK